MRSCVLSSFVSAAQRPVPSIILWALDRLRFVDPILPRFQDPRAAVVANLRGTLLPPPSLRDNAPPSCHHRELIQVRLQFTGFDTAAIAFRVLLADQPKGRTFQLMTDLHPIGVEELLHPLQLGEAVWRSVWYRMPATCVLRFRVTDEHAPAAIAHFLADVCSFASVDRVLKHHDNRSFEDMLASVDLFGDLMLIHATGIAETACRDEWIVTVEARANTHEMLDSFVTPSKFCAALAEHLPSLSNLQLAAFGPVVTSVLAASLTAPAVSAQIVSTVLSLEIKEAQR